MALEGTKHHNVPTSRGGTSEHVNISRVPARRHEAYHEWAWNREPGILVRLIALHGIGMDGKSLPANAFEDVLHVARAEDWRNLYVPEATIDSPRGSDRSQWDDATHYLAEHTAQEIHWVRRTIGALGIGNKYPVTGSDFLADSLFFFGAKSPQEAIRGLLTETRGGSLSWVRPMEDEVRRAILHIVEHADETLLSHPDKGKLIDVLRAHEQFLLYSLLWNEHGELMRDRMK